MEWRKWIVVALILSVIFAGAVIALEMFFAAGISASAGGLGPLLGGGIGALWLLSGIFFFIRRPKENKGPAVDELSAVFLDQNRPASERTDAIDTLAQYGSFAEEGVPFLIQALADPDREVREASAKALNEIDPEWMESEAAHKAVQRLITALSSRDRESRIASADALGRFGPSVADDVVPQLIGHIRDTDGEVRAAVVRSLGRMGPAADRAAPKLVEMITDANKNVRQAVGQTLIGMGQGTIPPLVKKLSSENENQRAIAVKILQRIDKNWAQHESAKEVVDHFLKQAKDGFGDARVSAIKALGVLGSNARAAIPDLVAGLIDGDSQVRSAALKTIKTVDPQWIKGKATLAAVPELVKAQVDSDRMVQKTAAKVLERVDPNWPAREDTIAQVPLFTKALSNSLETVRQSAAQVLEKIGPPAKSAVPALIERLADAVKPVREGAARALDAIEPEWQKQEAVGQKVEALVENLDSSDWRVRLGAAGALGELGRAAPGLSIPALVVHMADGDRNVRAAIRESLKKIDPKWFVSKAARGSLPKLMESLGHSQWGIRAAAVESLAFFGPSGAKITVPRLVKMMNTDSVTDVRNTAKRILQKVDPEGKYQSAG